MNNKAFYKSKTIIGAIVSILPIILPAMGLSFGSDDQMLVNSAVDAGFQLAGALLAVYGRVKAKDKVTL